jgi:hypothetical protein
MASVEGIHHVTDRRTGAVDRIPLTDPLDWNARLHVANGNGQPYPLDGMFWAVTDQGRAVEVSYDEDATFWMPADNAPYFSRQDGEPGTYGADEIVGWTLSCEDAEEAAALFARTA